MKTLKYKFGDTVLYRTYYNTAVEAIVWRTYNLTGSICDYTLLEFPDFTEVNENQIIRRIKLEPSMCTDLILDDGKVFIEQPVKEAASLLNIITRTNKFDLIIINYLNKTLSISCKEDDLKTSLSRTPSQNIISRCNNQKVQDYATKLLNLINIKHSEV